MKNSNLFLIVCLLLISHITNAHDESDNMISSIERVTEKKRIEIKNPKIGIIFYQTDNQSGLYRYTRDGWELIPTTNKQLETLMTCPKVAVVDLVFDLKDISCGTETVTTAIALGYHTKNDGGGGIFTYNSSLDNPNVDGEGDGGLVFDGWQRTIIDRSINVKWFGARANVPGAPQSFPPGIDPISDNNTAFKKALLAVEKSLQGGGNNDPGNNDLYGNTATLGVFIPSGEYILGENGLFDSINNGNAPNDPDEFDVVARNITYFSDGNAVLVFTNTGANKYAFRNENSGTFFTFRDITFVGTSSSTNFIFSNSNASIQDYFFDRCTFRGIFDKIFTLRGGGNNSGDLNSEWGFMKCAFLGSASVILDIKDSDQFLNYWFDQTKFWMTGNSRVLRADNGGHFKFVDCDWSRFAPTQETYLFELTDSQSAFGVNDFRIINGRFEMQTEHARVLKSNWNSGNIEITADFGAEVERSFFQNDVKHFEFNLAKNTNVNISFDNSVMMGYHEYNYANDSFEGTARASYTNCSFPVRNSLDGFIRIPSNSNINKSGISFIEIKDAIFSDLFVNALSNTHPLEIPTVNYLPLYSNRGLKKKYFKIGHPARGGNPINSEKFILNFPEESEAIITKVTWLLPANRLTSTRNVSFRLQNLSGATTYASVGGVMRDGYNDTDDVYIKVRDLPEGKLVLKAVSGKGFLLPDQTAAEFFCLIEYY